MKRLAVLLWVVMLMSMSQGLLMAQQQVSKSGVPNAATMGVSKAWEVSEITMTATHAHNWDSWPVSVTFTGTSGAASGKSLTVKGFWDGGNTWKVRFAPPYSGTWAYSSSSGDPGLNAQSGSITASDWSETEKQDNPTRRGMLKVNPSNPHFFAYADGTPFFWAADTWWQWSREGINLSTWKSLVDQRAAQGYNLGQVYVGGEQLLPPSTNPTPGDNFILNSPSGNPTNANLDINHFKNFDPFVAYANSKGITLWLTAFWSNPGSPDGRYFSADFAKNFYRYLLARYGAYNILFVLCGEHYASQVSGYWDPIGNMFESEDPYKHLVSIHTGSESNTPTYNTLNDKAWMKFHQHQHGHTFDLPRLLSEVSGGWAKNKPYVTTEITYQFGNSNFPENIIRAGAWISALSGAAGHTYGAGGIWEADVPEARSTCTWSSDPYETSIAYNGGAQFGYFARFFRSLEFSKLVPHQELISGNGDAYCAADPGLEYVVYLKSGGTVTVNLSATGSSLPVEWFNSRTGTYTSATAVTCGSSKVFTAPDNNDWVLHIGNGSGTVTPPPPSQPPVGPGSVNDGTG
ncbi:MAG: DUF4038 domain-containing protein, partial [Chlorobiales bacterium]|nr:DUF4038 domain-containing protein [Chlorobiales bacterium]